MHRLIVTACLLLLLSESAAFAQAGTADNAPYPQQNAKTSKTKFKGSKDEQNACFRDVNRYCADEIPEGDMKVLACLQDHRGKLSKGCAAVLAEHGQ
jgi:cysteine rich repeat protein